MPLAKSIAWMTSLFQTMMQIIADARRPGSAFGSLFGFLCVGGLGALCFVVLSSSVVWLDTGIPVWQTNAVCYASLIVPVYLMHRRFSFASQASHWQALPRYVAVQGMAVLLAALFSYVVHAMLVMPTVAASMLVIGLTSGVNFMALRSWAFVHEQWKTVAIP